MRGVLLDGAVCCLGLTLNHKSSTINPKYSCAGSERVGKSEATGDRLEEAKHINKSLSALGKPGCSPCPSPAYKCIQPCLASLIAKEPCSSCRLPLQHCIRKQCNANQSISYMMCLWNSSGESKDNDWEFNIH